MLFFSRVVKNCHGYRLVEVANELTKLYKIKAPFINVLCICTVTACISIPCFYILFERQTGSRPVPHNQEDGL
jgi:hypothetical protein